MNHFSSNLLILRKNNLLTQEQLAKKLGVKRTSIANYEGGFSTPDYEMLVKIASTFKVTIDILLQEDLSNYQINKQEDIIKAIIKDTLPDAKIATWEDGFWVDMKTGEKYPHEVTPNLTPNLTPNSENNTVSEPNEEYITGKNLKVRTVVVAVNEKNEEVIKMVPVFAHAGYLNGFSDPEYIEHLPSISITNMLPPGTYRAFEVRGDSMVDTFLPGDRVAGRFVENLTNIKSYQCYVVITHDEICLKRCVYKKNSLTMELHYDNPVYAEYSPDLLPIQEIREMWKVELRIQTSIPAPNKVNERINSLEKELKELKEKKNDT